MSRAPFFNSPRRVAAALLLLATVIAALLALMYAWTTDDAYIGLRYAKNLADGRGLVYNPGERVEGYTAFLWVVWQSLGFVHGIAPELFSNVSSITCHVGTVLLLGRLHEANRPTGGLPVPIAAFAVAIHPDLARFATSGIETAAYTFTLTAAATWLAVGERTPRRLVAGGLLFGIAALTRADGALPAFVAGAWVLALARPRWRGAFAFAGGFFALFAPFMVWRIAYYGDPLPNTYYFKSGGAGWWAQGWYYLRLYLDQYWGVLLAFPMLGYLATRARGRVCEAALLFVAVAAVYGLYIVRVGGDFMYARMFLPVSPLLLAAVEAGLLRLALDAGRPLAVGLALMVVTGPLLSERPALDAARSLGIVDEHWFYTELTDAAVLDARGEEMRAITAGLPVRWAIFGAEARTAFKSDVYVVVEGLTDKTIAKQTVAVRGRPGHEKLASAPYLVDVRRVHLVTHDQYFRETGLDRYIPTWPILLGPHLEAKIVHWDAPVLAAMRARGARFEDFPSFLDARIATLADAPLDELRVDYEKYRHFYFQFVDDPAREAPFKARLGTSP